jgi:hypothetical protein
MQKGEKVIFPAVMPQITEDFITPKQMVEEWEGYIKRIENLKDDRLYALVAELLAENAVNIYLSEIMPRYKQELADKRDFTFSLKIIIARELRFSPARYFNGADILRKVRNEFAHNLEMETFECLKSDLIKDMRKVLSTYREMSQPFNGSIREIFTVLTHTTVMGLLTFAKHVHSLNSYLRDEGLYDNLIEYCEKHTIVERRP